MEREEIIHRYNQGQSLKSIAKEADVCYTVIRRVLISAGIPLRECPRSQSIIDMLDKGCSVDDVAAAHHITPRTVKDYLPYTKCAYAVDPQSENAKRIEKCRERKMSSEQRP